jgi:hypothetical protein
MDDAAVPYDFALQERASTAQLAAHFPACLRVAAAACSFDEAPEHLIARQCERIRHPVGQIRPDLSIIFRKNP